MRPLYEACGTMELSRFEAINTACFKLKKLPLLFGTAMVICLIAAWIFGMANGWTYCIPPLVFACVFGVCIVRMPRSSARRLYQSAKGIANLPFTMRFFDDEFLEFTPTGEQHTRYADILFAVYTPQMLVIFISEAQGYVLYPGDFTIGTLMDLVTYLHRQKQVPFKKI